MSDPRKRHLAELFQFLDGSRIGKEYLAAVTAGDEAAAVAAVAEYFRNRPRKSFFNHIGEKEYSPETAARAVAGDVAFSGIRWQFPDGRINWNCDPSEKVTGTANYEWTWQLNRMGFWNDMALAYLHSGDESITVAFDRQLRDFVLLTECPESYDGPNPDNWKPWNCPCSAWRTLDTGLRMQYSWQTAFEVFRKSDRFPDESLCLMLASMHRQALHLQTRHNKTTNRLLMEMSGLFVFSAFFDEFKDAGNLREYALQHFAEALDVQILPDGMHYELASGYFKIILDFAANIMRAAKAGNGLAEIPESLFTQFRRMCDAIILQVTPGFRFASHNDSSVISAAEAAGIALEFYPERKDLLWVNSFRKQGQPPDFPTASTVMPFAGCVMMRSGWDADALFCRFDTGPRGCGHRHWDKLNVNIFKGDEELIFDDGGGEYECSIFREYGRSSADHNTVLVDGMVQSRTEPQRYFEPDFAGFETNECWDYAVSVYDQEFSGLDLERNPMPRFYPAVHQREVKLCKPDFFCVVDTLTASDGNEHEYELRWQLDTLNVAAVPDIPGAWRADFGKKWDLLAIPLCRDGLTAEVLKGTLPPRIGGWFLAKGKRREASTLCMRSTGRNCRFATLLIPVRPGGVLPEIENTGENKYRICFNGNEYLLDISDLKNN